MRCKAGGIVVGVARPRGKWDSAGATLLRLGHGTRVTMPTACQKKQPFPASIRNKIILKIHKCVDSKGKAGYNPAVTHLSVLAH